MPGVWRYDLETGELEQVLEVDQSLDNDPRYDVGTAVAGAGGWESSGIIDASSIWGPWLRSSSTSRPAR